MGEIKNCSLQCRSRKLGTQRRGKTKRLKVWHEELQKAILLKKESYKKWLCTKQQEDYINYKHRRALVHRLSRTAKRESWNQFVSRLERDITGAQRHGFKIFKNLKETTDDRAKIDVISEEEWLKYYGKLLVTEDVLQTIETKHSGELNAITMHELETVLKQAKNRKAPGIDGINMELWKYGSRKLKIRILQLFNDIWCTWVKFLKNGIQHKL